MMLFAEVSGGWMHSSLLGSRQDIMQSIAVQPSDMGHTSQLATGFSFTEQQSQAAPSQLNCLLNSRHSHDLENRQFQVGLLCCITRQHVNFPKS